MYPTAFDYHAPSSVEDALRLLGSHGDDAKLLAGGHSLIPILKLRFAQPAHLIDLRRIPGLSGIREDGDAVVIGAMTTHRAVEHSELLARRLPMLPEAAAQIGDPLVRNVGTVGGSLVHADPAADLPAVVLATGAELRAVGPRGPRTIAVDDFFVGLMTSALAADELLTEVRVPLPRGRTGGAYEKHRHPASGYALVGVAAMLTLDDAGAVASARVALTGLGDRAVRAPAAERALAGQTVDDALLDRAAAAVAAASEPRADLQGGADYKRNLARVCARRAIARAAARARG